MFLEALTINGVHFRRSRSEVMLCCPMDGCGDMRFRLGVNTYTNKAHCFNCNWSSRFNSMNKVLVALHASEAVEFQDHGEEAAEEQIQLPDDFQLLSEINLFEEEPDSPYYQAKMYALMRGLTSRQLRQKFIGCSMVGRFSYRVIFPVLFNKKFLGMVCRDFTGNRQPKYLNSYGKKFLYNLRQGSYCILAEGVIKALRIEAALGVMGVALLGHSITDSMLAQLREAEVKRVLVWPDVNAVGVDGALEVAAKCAEHGLDTEILYPVPLADADNMQDCEIVKAYQSASRFDWTVEQGLRMGIAFGNRVAGKPIAKKRGSA